MDLLSSLHHGVLFAHVVALALTLSAALRADWRLLTKRRVDERRLAHTARAVLLGLSALWSTGLALVALVALDAAMGPLPWLPAWGVVAYAALHGVVIALCFVLALVALRASRAIVGRLGATALTPGCSTQATP
jgi:hypothetical protein